MAIRLEGYEFLSHPSNHIPVNSKPCPQIHSYRVLKWEYTWRNEYFFTKAMELYINLINLTKEGIIEWEATLSHVICDNWYLRFKCFKALRNRVEEWDFDEFKDMDHDECIKNIQAKAKELRRLYVHSIPIYAHRIIAKSRKTSRRLKKEYGYSSILLEHSTTPWPIDIIIEIISDGLFPARMEQTIDTKAITVYDNKKYNTNKYDYVGDILLSIDFSKSDDTILNDIKLLIKEHRNRKSCLDEPIFIDSEKAEIIHKTKTKLSIDDLKRRLIGLYLFDYCDLYECGGPTAIKALAETGYVAQLGLQSLLDDPQHRQLLRLLANAKKCVESANVLPIVNR
jgi:hypothetical protein